MIRHNFKLFAWMIVGLTILVFLLQLHYQIDDPTKITYQEIFKVISNTVLVITLYGFAFNRYLWHLPVFTFMHWFVKVPYLAGEWTGIIRYKWPLDAPDWSEKPMSIKIKQTFLHIQVSVKTDESWSKTIGGTFDVDEDNGFSSLIYTYLNTPNADVRDRSQIHYGTAILSISDDMQTLHGNYFNDRKASGVMTMQKV